LLKENFKSFEKLTLLFRQLNIKKGDNLMLHSNIAGIYQFEKKINNNYLDHFIKFILNHIGNEGTLLIPTYNYNFIQGEPYNRRKSECQVGLLGNFLLKKHYRSRTMAPVFNHLVFGKLKKKIFDCDVKEVFGSRSIFAIIKKKNFKIICFCCSPKEMTFIHYVERYLKVDYRSNKFFNGYLNKKKFCIKYFAGEKKIDYSLKEKKILKLKNNREFRECQYGRFKSYSVESNFLFRELKKKINKKKNYLIKN
jgi:aminoglycoside 3-N-acetyltransferase|tara:strand:+ start:1896 stop:2651 length:756 start_codon:yes stop_codon:yes gene_type:complete